jgi:hypothetical protein
MVWHHRRDSLRTFWRQQVGYGAAEGQLELKWPDRYNGGGYATWLGRIYGPGRIRAPRRRALIYQGPWGTAPFQSLYERDPHSVWVLAALPEWRVLVVILTALSALGIVWRPLLLAAPLAGACAFVMLVQAFISARHARFSRPRLSLRLITAALFVVQPAARLYGRLRARRRARSSWSVVGLRSARLPRRRISAYWSETWREPAVWLARMLDELVGRGHIVRTGRDYDPWDLHVVGGRLGAARLLVAFEDNGSGNQYLRFRVWPCASKFASAIALTCLTVAVLAAVAGSVVVAATLGLTGVLLAAGIAGQCAVSLERLSSVVPFNETPSP